MAKYASSNVLDGGFNYFKGAVSKIIILSQYTAGDSFTAVNVTNNVGEVATTGTEFPVSGANAAPRTMTTPSKNGVTASGNAPGSPDLHVAYVSGSEVLLVTDEMSNQAIVSGNTYNIPATTYTIPQPV